jgi:hypothetical protein
VLGGPLSSALTGVGMAVGSPGAAGSLPRWGSNEIGPARRCAEAEQLDASEWLPAELAAAPLNADWSCAHYAYRIIQLFGWEILPGGTKLQRRTGQQAVGVGTWDSRLRFRLAPKATKCNCQCDKEEEKEKRWNVRPLSASHRRSP